jgi:two-component system, chemotaxis family, protein-glutamate methylesterase/glutaminase
VSTRVVVVGASAGGVEALKRLVAELPADLDAAVVVVLHIPTRSTSVLPEILDRATPFRARSAEDGDVLEAGVVYVAPPDRHVLVRGDRLQVVRGPRENGHRPAIDPLFRSAAATRGNEVIAVVLTGVLDDGSAGVVAVSRHGGTVVVQDPADAAFPDMPAHAIADDSPEAILPLDEIATFLAKTVREPPPRHEGSEAMSDDDQLETDYAALQRDAIARPNPPGELAPFGCPDCGGVLTEVDDEQLIRFRCRVGHAYSADVLLECQEETVEQALFTALRALEERADLSRRFARRLRRNDLGRRAELAEEDAVNDERQAEVVRQLLTRPPVRVANEKAAVENGGGSRRQ